MKTEITLCRDEWPVHLDAARRSLLEQAEALISPNRATPPSDLDVELAWSSIRSSLICEDIQYFLRHHGGIEPQSIAQGVVVNEHLDDSLDNFELCTVAREHLRDMDINTVRQLKATEEKTIRAAFGRWDAAADQVIELRNAEYAPITVSERVPELSEILQLSVRAANVLDSAGITKMEDLAKCSQEKLASLRHSSASTALEIASKYQQHTGDALEAGEADTPPDRQTTNEAAGPL